MGFPSIRLLAAAVVVGVAVAVATGAALAESVSDGDKTAIVSVIGSQMDAFKRDDAKAAFSFAAPSIQEKFRDPATFMRMVRTGYLPVYRPRAVRFLDTVDHGGLTLQRVWIEGPDGKPVIAIYIMGKMPDGSWRIRGVDLVEPDGTGI